MWYSSVEIKPMYGFCGTKEIVIENWNENQYFVSMIEGIKD